MKKYTVIFILILTAALSSASIGSTMYFVHWEIESTSDLLTGHALYIYDNDSMFRVEVTTQPLKGSSSFDSLYNRDGEGWTVTPSSGGSLVIQPWSGQYSELDETQYSACLTLLEILQTSNEGRNSFFVALKDPIFYEDNIATKPAELLNIMRIRGAGRGADQEIWSVDISGEPVPIVKISSNRTPAVLRISKISFHEISDDIEMLFVPLWSLDNLIKNN